MKAASRVWSFCLLPLALVALTSNLLAQEQQAVIRLWAGDAPGALGQADHDVPTLTIFPAKGENPTTMGIVICPGGGYGGLAGHEGAGYANYLSNNGIASFVLRYRLGSKGYRHPVMLQDVSRAIRTVRSRAAEWNLDAKLIGVMGSSAGGHLASTAVTHFDAGQPDAQDPIDRVSSRPDFGVLCYAVISMEDGVTHGGSKRNLLGPTPDPALVDLLSNEKQVTKETPPCFVWSTGEDKAVPVENSLRFVTAMQKSGVPYDFHIFQKGPHGIGLSDGRHGIATTDVHPWGKDLLFWFQQNGWIKKQ